MFQHTAARRRLGQRQNIQSQEKSFNTQPPEGGWRLLPLTDTTFTGFNTQPPEGGWPPEKTPKRLKNEFQHTAARRRLDGVGDGVDFGFAVSTHSRPKAAGAVNALGMAVVIVSTHSRPKAAGSYRLNRYMHMPLFQHTAARRRLAALSTRPRLPPKSFNTQPPEGGWCLSQKPCSIRFRSPNFAKLLRKAQTRV